MRRKVYRLPVILLILALYASTGWSESVLGNASDNGGASMIAEAAEWVENNAASQLKYSGEMTLSAEGETARATLDLEADANGALVLNLELEWPMMEKVAFRARFGAESLTLEHESFPIPISIAYADILSALYANSGMSAEEIDYLSGAVYEDIVTAAGGIEKALEIIMDVPGPIQTESTENGGTRMYAYVTVSDIGAWIERCATKLMTNGALRQTFSGLKILDYANAYGAQYGGPEDGAPPRHQIDWFILPGVLFPVFEAGKSISQLDGGVGFDISYEDGVHIGMLDVTVSDERSNEVVSIEAYFDGAAKTATIRCDFIEMTVDIIIDDAGISAAIHDVNARTTYLAGAQWTDDGFSASYMSHDAYYDWNSQAVFIDRHTAYDAGDSAHRITDIWTINTAGDSIFTEMSGGYDSVTTIEIDTMLTSDPESLTLTVNGDVKSTTSNSPVAFSATHRLTRQETPPKPSMGAVLPYNGGLEDIIDMFAP